MVPLQRTNARREKRPRPAHFRNFIPPRIAKSGAIQPSSLNYENFWGDDFLPNAQLQTYIGRLVLEGTRPD